jgi:phosphate starvation-inducible PhoH-like protein
MIFHRLIYLLATPFTIHAFKNIRSTKYIIPLTGHSNLLSSFRTYLSSKNDIPKPKNLAPKYIPKTPNQKLYHTHLNNPETSIVLGIGPAGCGKTLFACITALDQLKKGNIEKIVLTRPIVPVEDEEIGFLPGNLINKMDPWTRPIFDIILEQYQQHELTMMLKNNIIEVSPLAFMRGRTFKNAIIIADEMQNSTPNQMLMLTTRIGTNSKLVITGDLKQSDKTNQNGLRDLMYKLRRPENENLTEIKMVEMQYEDVERSPIVKIMLDIYDDKRNKEPMINYKYSQGPSVFGDKKDNDAALIPRDQYKDI